MTRPIRVFIVDDEPLARKTIRILLEEDSEIDIVGEGAGEEALTEIETSVPDLLFLDIEMPGLNGFDLLDRLQPERLPAVIFVTAYDEHAIRAFEHHALDYLLKPFDDTRFERTLRHAKEQIRLRNRGEASERVLEFLDKRSGGTIALRRLLVQHDGKLVVVPTAEIDWIEAADYYARIHAGPKSWLHRQSLSQLEQRLDRSRFCRVHRSAIVNVERIRELKPHFHGDWIAVLRDDTQVRVSRSRRDDLERLLGRG